MYETPFSRRYSGEFLKEVYKRGDIKAFAKHIDFMLGGIEYHHAEYCNNHGFPDQQYYHYEMETHYRFWKDQFIGAEMDMNDEVSSIS